MEQTQSAQQALPPFLTDPISEIPEWMTSGNQLAVKPLTPKEMKLHTEALYTAFFETVLEKIASGMVLTNVIEEDGRYNTVQYRHWIMRDPERKVRYHNARAMAAEMIEDQLINIADAIDSDGRMSMEDVQRSSLRIKTRQWLLGVWDKERYGSSHSLEVKNTTPLTDNSLEALAGRLQSLRRQAAGDVVDVEARES